MSPKDKARAYHLKGTYGLTLEQYQQLFDAQEGRCFICRKHQDEFKQRLHVDHDHVTLEVRGLLCNFCNSRLVGRHRDPELFRRAAEHLERKTGWFTPPPRRKRRKRK